MRKAAYQYGYLYQILLGVMVAIGLTLWLTGVVSAAAFYVSAVVFLLAAFQPFTATVVIDENGVTARMFGMKKGAIKWSDMEEVGIGSQHEAGRRFVYFSVYKWDGDKRIRVMRQKQNNRSIWAEATPGVLDEVGKYFKGKIRYLKESGQA